MTWTTAWISMKQGHKVRRQHWAENSFMEIVGTEVIIHAPDGTSRNLQEVQDLAMYLCITCCDDWAIAEK